MASIYQRSGSSAASHTLEDSEFSITGNEKSSSERLAGDEWDGKDQTIRPSNLGVIRLSYRHDDGSPPTLPPATIVEHWRYQWALLSIFVRISLHSR